MFEKKPAAGLGRHVFGLGIMAYGALGLAWGTFIPGQPVPKAMPGHGVLAVAAAILMLAAGAAVQLRRTLAWGAAALGLYYGLAVIVLMNGPVIAANARVYGTYSGVAEEFSVLAASMILYAASAEIDAMTAARLIRAGQIIFGVCAVLFGGAHFVYMNFTAPLVPKWLPPSQEFWGYATGMGHVAAGLAILSAVRARLAAILLTAMYASFTFLVHGPMLLADPGNHGILSENAINIALTGVAWVVADSLARRRCSGVVAAAD